MNKYSSLISVCIFCLCILSVMPDIHAAESYVSFPGSSSLADTGRTEKIEIDTVSFKIRFRVGDAVIDPTFADNSTVLGSLDDFLGKLRNDTARHIEAV